MANYSKAFNFRGGFQVDTDVLVVRGEKVGIGSTAPTEVLDVNGIIKAKGLDVDATEGINFSEGSIGILTVRDELYVGVSTLDNHGTIIAIGTGIITATSNSVGLVTYYGDGRFLQGLPTSQWVDIDVGLGYTSIYAAGNVGVDTIDPRYAFQVGGVPFVIDAGIATTPLRFNQQGVGIEDGSVYISDNLRVGGGISVTGTIGVGQTINIDDAVSIGGSLTVEGSTSIGGSLGIGSDLTVVGFVSAYEFIGIGSQLSVLNADNIAIGSIGSMRYGDIINTKEVYADRFIGTATSAEDLTPDAQISIDTIRANEIDAVNRFISTEGKLQIGSADAIGDVSDIDLIRTGNAVISGISTTGTSRILAGRQRPSTGSREYGGIRFGGEPIDGVTGGHDLDLVNYDIGNVSSFLHSGSGGTTDGEFRWVYGQNDRILATLTKEGKYTLFGGGVSGETNLVVVGVSSIEELKVGEISAGIGSVLGDWTVYGQLNIAGGVGISSDIEFLGATFTDDVVIGGNPLDGETGVLLTPGGVISASSGINLTFSGTQVFGVDPSGSITANGDITASSGTITGLNVNGTNITASTTFAGPSLSNSAQLTSVVDLQSTGNASFNTIDAASASIAAIETTNIGFGTATTSIDGSTIIVDDIQVNNSISGSFNFTGNIEFNTVNVSNLYVSNEIQSPTGIITSLISDSLIVSEIQASQSSIEVNGGLDVTGITSTSQAYVTDLIATNATIDNLTAERVSVGVGTSSLEVNGNVTLTGGAIAKVGTIDISESDSIICSFGTLTFNLINGGSELEIEVSDGVNTSSGTINLS